MLRRGAALLLFAACFPPPLDETGLLCDGTHPCDTGYLCFDNVCGRPGEIDAGPDNWILNPSFEQVVDAGAMDFPLDWARSGGGQEALIDLNDAPGAHSGQRYVRLSSNDGGIPAVLTNPAPVMGTLLGQAWCARAFVKSNADDGGIIAQLLLRERDDGGTTINTNPVPQKLRVGTSGWVMLNESFTAKGAFKLDVRVSYSGAADRGQFLFVDDVQLKRSIDGTCSW
jgi:hypothetical protein